MGIDDRYHVKIKTGEGFARSSMGTTVTLCDKKSGLEVPVPNVRGVTITMDVDAAVIAKIELVGYPGELEIQAIPEFIFWQQKE